MLMSTVSTSTVDRVGLGLALMAAILFSTKPILIKWLYAEGITALPLLWLRMTLALPIYLIIGAWAWQRYRPRQWGDVILACGVGLLGYYLAALLDMLGLQYVSAQLERLTLYAYPTLVVLLSAMVFKQPVGARQVAALVLTYLGLACVYGQDVSLAEAAQVNTGTLLILGSAVSFALYLVFSKGFIMRMGALLFTSLSMVMAALATSVHWLITGTARLPDMTPTLWWGAIGLALFATVLPTFMISAAIKRIGPVRTSISGTIGPITTTLLAVWLLAEPFTVWAGVGMALVIAGVGLLQR